MGRHRGVFCPSGLGKPSTFLCLAHVLVGEPVSTSPQYLGERGRAQSVKTHFVEHRHRRLYDR
jgi:hypothetical protein